MEYNKGFTKNSQLMAFITIEDLYGSVEVLVFPKDYERYKTQLVEDEKILVAGRVSIGDEAEGKLILESMLPFADVPKELWLQFEDRTAYEELYPAAEEIFSPFDGENGVVVYLKKEHAKKNLPPSMSVRVCPELLNALKACIGEKNVAVVYRQAALVK